jgi:hypothetical protein
MDGGVPTVVILIHDTWSREGRGEVDKVRTWDGSEAFYPANWEARTWNRGCHLKSCY